MKNGAYIDTHGNICVRTKNGWHIAGKDDLEYVYFSRYRDWKKSMDEVAKRLKWDIIWEFSE